MAFFGVFFGVALTGLSSSSSSLTASLSSVGSFFVARRARFFGGETFVSASSSAPGVGKAVARLCGNSLMSPVSSTFTGLRLRLREAGTGVKGGLESGCDLFAGTAVRAAEARVVRAMVNTVLVKDGRVVLEPCRGKLTCIKLTDLNRRMMVDVVDYVYQGCDRVARPTLSLEWARRRQRCEVEGSEI